MLPSGQPIRIPVNMMEHISADVITVNACILSLKRSLCTMYNMPWRLPPEGHSQTLVATTLGSWEWPHLTLREGEKA